MTIVIPAKLVEEVRGAEHIVVLTGAGVSAESGIPTFREAQTGLWAKFDPEDIATPYAFKRNPQLVWEWYAWRRELLDDKEPNAGHYALAQMERLANRFTLITQNVDGLHQVAGNKHPIELHGNITRYKCFDRHHPIADLGGGNPPRCPRCGSFVRPDVVWFGEGLSETQLTEAFNASEACQVFFSIGTSALVYPAAWLPEAAVQAGAVLVEINPERTPLSRYADYLLSGRSGEILPQLVEQVWSPHGDSSGDS